MIMVNFVIRHVPLEEVEALRTELSEYYPLMTLRVRVRGRGSRDHGRYDQDLPIEKSQWCSVYVEGFPPSMKRPVYTSHLPTRQSYDWIGRDVTGKAVMRTTSTKRSNGHGLPLWMSRDTLGTELSATG